MLNQIEESLLNRLTNGGVSSIFRTVYGFLPPDAVASLGTYLRQLVTKPREVLIEDTAIVANAIKATAAVNHIADPGTFDTISMDTVNLKNGRQWTLICDGIVSWTAAGNVAVLGTCPALTTVTFTYDSGSQKWYPSKVA